jgi:hypothetical protein
MGKGAGVRPGHGEHEVQWDAEGLGAVNVREAGRVGDDGFGHEGATCVRIGLETCPPAAVQHVGHHAAFPLDIAGPEATQAGHQPWVLHHVRHELAWIAAYGVELEPGLAGALAEDVVRRHTHTVAVAPERLTQGNEGLDIAAAADKLDDDVKAPWQGTARGVLSDAVRPMPLRLT